SSTGTPSSRPALALWSSTSLFIAAVPVVLTSSALLDRSTTDTPANTLVNLNTGGCGAAQTWVTYALPLFTATLNSWFGPQATAAPVPPSARVGPTPVEMVLSATVLAAVRLESGISTSRPWRPLSCVSGELPLGAPKNCVTHAVSSESSPSRSLVTVTAR